MNAFLSQWAFRLSLVLALAVAPAMARAESKQKLKAADFQTVEMFSAIKSGEIEVQFIPKNSTTANVLIRNKTDKPLSVSLPAAFAGVPVLAQFGAGGGLAGGGAGGAGLGGGGLGGGGLGGGGGGQGLGGGFGGGGGGLGGGGFGGGGFGGGGFGGGGGGGFFNVAPDKVGKISVDTLCLEHGKPDPNPRMKYEIRPIDTFTKDNRVIELCKMLARGEVPQNAAQAAAWNMTNGLTWQELAAKEKFRSQFTGKVERYFTPREIELAAQITQAVAARAENSAASPGEQKAQGTTSPGESSGSRSQSFAGGR